MQTKPCCFLSLEPSRSRVFLWIRTTSPQISSESHVLFASRIHRKSLTAIDQVYDYLSRSCYATPTSFEEVITVPREWPTHLFIEKYFPNPVVLELRVELCGVTSPGWILLVDEVRASPLSPGNFPKNRHHTRWHNPCRAVSIRRQMTTLFASKSIGACGLATCSD